MLNMELENVYAGRVPEASSSKSSHFPLEVTGLHALWFCVACKMGPVSRNALGIVRQMFMTWGMPAHAQIWRLSPVGGNSRQLT